MFQTPAKKNLKKARQVSANKLIERFKKRSKNQTDSEDADLIQSLFKRALKEAEVQTEGDSLMAAMPHLSSQNHTLAEHSKMRDRARGRIKGSLTSGNILELARYLLSAKAEPHNDYSQTIALVREQSPHARTIKVKGKSTKQGYMTFARGMLEHVHVQVHNAIQEAAASTVPQADTESVHDYLERAKADMDALEFGLGCSGPSERKLNTLHATKISSTINSLREELKGKLPTEQREKRMDSDSCTWRTIRTRAGAQEKELGHPTATRPKKPKSSAAVASVAAPTAWEARIAALEQRPATAQANAIQPAWEDRLAALEQGTRPAPANAAPSLQEIVAGLAPLLAINAVGPPPTGLPPFPPGQGPADLPRWPALCHNCKIVHQSFSECPLCKCHNCDSQGHVAKSCTQPCKTCRKKPDDAHRTLNDRHHPGCAVREYFRKNAGRR